MNGSRQFSPKVDIHTGHLPQKSRLTGLPVSNLEHIKEQAEAGDPVAQYELGWMHENGNGVGQNHMEAANWYLKAAENGVVQAQVNLGWIYRNGRGVKHDLSKSKEWYRKATRHYRKEAEGGNVIAELTLGWMYESGEAVERDYAEAVSWYRRAAEHGSHRAQFDLGGMYYGGYGVEQDFAEAYKWFWLSGADGWGRYADHMMDEQIAEGQRRARAFQRNLQNNVRQKSNSVEVYSEQFNVELFRLA